MVGLLNYMLYILIMLGRYNIFHNKIKNDLAKIKTMTLRKLHLKFESNPAFMDQKRNFNRQKQLMYA